MYITKNYVDYVARRPRAERTAGKHGLWTSSNGEISLTKVTDELINHKGYIWNHVVSLRREDAERLGFDNASAWRDLVKEKIPVIAKSMNIKDKDLRWYGAFHDESHHPHIHLIVYSANPKNGFLKNAGIEKMRSAFSTAIFKNDLMHIYEQRTELRTELNLFAEQQVKSLVEQINAEEYANPVVQEMMVQLSQELKTLKGQKVYGNLKGAEKYKAKNLVDGIVNELSKDTKIAEIYGHWCDLQTEIKRTDMDKTPVPVDLVDEPEFTKIKNMIIKQAQSISEVEIEMESEVVSEVLSEADEIFFEDVIVMPKHSADWSKEYKEARKYFYGKDVEQDYKKAYKLFLREAEKGNALALYDVGKMHLAGLYVEQSESVAQEWFEKTYDAFVSAPAKNHKDYIQYRIGKLYNLGHGVSKDYEKAAQWFQKSAAQNNQFAQYSLGNLYAYGNGVEQSFETAFDLYSRAYKQENAFATYELGKMHRDGVGTEVELEKSRGCFKMAFKSFVEAENFNGGEQLQHRIGQMCLMGEGTEVDVPRATYYFNKAMELGNIYSANALAKIYLDKEYRDLGLDIDMGKVIEKLTLSEDNNEMAQYSLGKIYYWADDYKDLEKAMMWLEKSASQGNEHAQKMIDYINNPPNQMSPATATANLMRQLSRIFADDYENQRRKYEAHIDKKLMRKIIQKKESLGQKQSFN